VRIARIKIHNFRSIRDLEMECSSQVVLVGANNHGKSNILRAIAFSLEPRAKLTADDFFKSPDETRSTELSVELTFGELDEQEATTFHNYLDDQGDFTVQKSAIRDEGDIEYRSSGYVTQRVEWWLRGDQAWPKLNTPEKVRLEAASVPELNPLAEGCRLTKARLTELHDDRIRLHEATLEFETSLEDGHVLGSRRMKPGVFPDLHFLPAVRDLTQESKTQSTATFGKLWSRTITELARMS